MKDRSRQTLWMAGGAALALLAARTAVRQLRKFDLYHRTVLLTGGSRGLGLVLARQLAEYEVRLAICARDEAELNRAREDLSFLGANVLAVQCDLTKPAQIDGMIEGILRHFGPIEVLINNAGTIQVGPQPEMTFDDYDQAMQLHFYAPLRTTLAVLPYMRRAGEGRIVNIASIGGKIAAPHLLPYSASKFALVGFSEGLRAELLRDNIYVTTVCPGLMRTGSPRNALFKGRHREEFTWFSIADSLPGLSISAKRAARQIISAMVHGQPELILSLPAKFVTWFHGLMPGLTSELSAWTNRLLPEPGGIGTQKAKGSQSESELSPSPLTTLSDRAAVENNQVPT